MLRLAAAFKAAPFQSYFLPPTIQNLAWEKRHQEIIRKKFNKVLIVTFEFWLLFPLYELGTGEMCDDSGLSWCVFLYVNGLLLPLKIKSCVHFIPTQKLV